MEIIHKSNYTRFLPEDLIVDEFFSTVPGKNFDLCIISTRTYNTITLLIHLAIYPQVNANIAKGNVILMSWALEGDCVIMHIASTS